MRIIVLFWSLFYLQHSCAVNNNTLLLVVSFDGFRPDYLKRGKTEHLITFRKSGTYIDYLLNVFPTKTFPNHFSIATGLYTEVHGVIDNRFFDIKLGKYLEYGYEMFHYNKDVVPIWTLNERGGQERRSGCMMFPGCDFEYQDTYITFNTSFDLGTFWENRVDEMIEWFTHPNTPINLGLMYFEEPDLTCHSFGPDSLQVNEQLRRINGIVSYLLDQVEKANLTSSLNIVFLSDHGGEKVKREQVIDLNILVNPTWFKRYGVSPNQHIYPEPGKQQDVAAALKKLRNMPGSNFTTYTKEELPERWHFKNCNRTPPIFMTAGSGFYFNVSHKLNRVFGTHGYDNDEPNMRAMFMAAGPLIKVNHSVPPFHNTDLYPLFAHMLGLPLPPIKPNGSYLMVSDVLDMPSEALSWWILGIPVSIICSAVIIIIIGLLLYLYMIINLVKL